MTAVSVGGVELKEEKVKNKKMEKRQRGRKNVVVEKLREKQDNKNKIRKKR